MPQVQTAAGSPHVRAKRERRREEILRAALRAFRERGYHATTLDDIAEHLGVRKTALYHYFPDKESILHECHRESLVELDRIVTEARRLRGARERVRHVIQEHVRVMTDTLQGSPLAFEVTAFSPVRQAEMIAARDRYEHELRRFIDQGIRDGTFHRADSKIATFAILGAINWIARWYRPEGSLHAAELGAQFADLLMGGLGANAKPKLADRTRRPSAARAARPRRTGDGAGTRSRRAGTRRIPEGSESPS